MMLKLILLIILIPVLLVAVSAPIGATICGWMALGQIKRSNGRLHGKGLAWFAALCYPLLLLVPLLAAAVILLLRFFFSPQMNPSPRFGGPVVADSHPTWFGLFQVNTVLILVAFALTLAFILWAVLRKSGQSGVNAKRTGSGKGCLIALLVCGVLALPLIFVVLAFFWVMPARVVTHGSRPMFAEARSMVETGPSIHRIEYRYPNASPATLEETVARPVALRLQGLANVESVTTHCGRGTATVYVAARSGLSESQFSELNQRILSAVSGMRGQLPAAASFQSQSLCTSIPNVAARGMVDEISIVVDRDKAAALGVGLETIDETIAKTRGGRPDSPTVLRDLRQAVISAHGLRVPLDQVATLTMEKAPSAIINTYLAQPTAEAQP